MTETDKSISFSNDTIEGFKKKRRMQKALRPKGFEISWNQIQQWVSEMAHFMDINKKKWKR
jgi:hypothetical protein